MHHQWIFEEDLKVNFHGLEVTANEARIIQLRFFWPEEKPPADVTGRTKRKFPHIEVVYRLGKLDTEKWQPYQEESYLIVDNDPEREDQKPFSKICGNYEGQSDLCHKIFRLLSSERRLPKGMLGVIS